MGTNMYKTIQIAFLALTLVLVSGCKIDTQPETNVLRISFVSAKHDHWDWAAATKMIFKYNNIYYSQNDIIDYHEYRYGYGDVSIDKISWLLWDLGSIDSLLTGTLSFHEIRSNIDSGNPILLHYGNSYDGRYMLLHGYDDNGYVYLHAPYYGTRIIYYDDLFYRELRGLGYYWVSSLIILG